MAGVSRSMAADANRHTVRDSRAQRVCNLVGISKAEKELVEFEELKKGIEASLKDLERAKKREDIVASAFLTLKFTKATCDAFISLAATLSSNKAAEKVKTAYGVADTLAEVAGTAIAGGKVDYTKAATSLAKSATDLIPEKGVGGVAKREAKYLGKSGVVKTKMVISALNSDEKGVKKAARDYMSDLTKYTLDVLEKKAAKKFVEISKDTFEYKEALDGMFEESIKQSEESRERYQNARMTFARSARRLQNKIDEIRHFLENCKIPEEEGSVSTGMRGKVLP